MPCPYDGGRDTALPWTLYHSGAAGIDIKSGQTDPKQAREKAVGTQHCCVLEYSVFQIYRYYQYPRRDTALPCPYKN